MLHRLFVGACLLMVAAVSNAQDIKAMSSEDRAEIDSLLLAFDPNSYDLRFQFTDASGKVVAAQRGKAKGLASVTARDTSRASAPAVAGTVTTNNIFRTASTVTVNNIFRAAAPGTVTTNNIFRSTAGTVTTNNIFRSAAPGSVTTNNIFSQAELEAKALKLEAILNKYSR